MKKAKDTSAVPNGGMWHYVCPEDGHRISHPYFNAILSKAIEYRRVNNYPIGLQIADQVEDNLCSNAVPETCLDWEPPTLGQKVQSLTQALFAAARTGFSVVSAEEYQHRLSICEQCNFFGGQKGLLKVLCRKCGCSGFKAYLSSGSKCPDNRW